jgi:carotenoid cleavage dioxygenase-like enzyme
VPNPRQATAHWFTGDGMIHGVRIEGGRAAWYRNRWVRTDSFSDDFPLYNADGTRNLRAGTANTHLVNHAGKTLALVESSLPYEITNDLETVGAYDFGGKLVDSMTAHPKICPTTGEMHFFGYGSIFEPYVTYHRADANGELIINRPLDVKAHTMMHDFALTAEHVIFMDLPIVFNLDVAMKGEGDMPYRWSDDYGARFGVMRRDDPFGQVRWFDIDPCYVFHVANAFDTTSARGTIIALQAVRYPELWCDTGGFDANGVLWSWTIDLRTGTVTERQLDDRAVEFPRIDDRLATLPARYAVSVGDGRLVRYDLTSGDAVEHAFGTAESPGGPGEAAGSRPKRTYAPDRSRARRRRRPPAGSARGSRRTGCTLPLTARHRQRGNPAGYRPPHAPEGLRSANRTQTPTASCRRSICARSLRTSPALSSDPDESRQPSFGLPLYGSRAHRDTIHHEPTPGCPG